jgi:hypothetical protein
MTKFILNHEGYVALNELEFNFPELYENLSQRVKDAHEEFNATMYFIEQEDTYTEVDYEIEDVEY